MTIVPDVKEPTHAGGVVYRMRAGEPEFLLVTARRSPQEWVLPKGHLEPAESAEQAAVREVREEAGIDAVIEAPLGDVAFEVDGKRQVIRYYLMKTAQDGVAGEGRRLAWRSVGEAMRTLTFAEARASLQRAVDVLRRGENA